ncbi:MAG TPA: SMP-30/gluconolactonase/LRE family protein [Candidatus Limnocylindrales bacterium]|nr:SMP-30/gluconolactonase/LRE family protein [Candidatus Limnocylindrales bacterium]
MPLEPIVLDSVKKIGLGLQRPEDVVVSRDGRVWASDQASACAEILADGSLRRLGKAGGAPNGINMDLEGNIIIANFFDGPLQKLDVTSGDVTTVCNEVEGVRLTHANYPLVDSRGNIWCTNSTYADPWETALDGRSDGFLFRVAPDGTGTILADGIQFANGIALDAEERFLCVCQTTGCNVLRYPIHGDGSLGPAELYGPVLGERIPAGVTPDQLPPPEVLRTLGLTDGCAFDAEGNLWVTLVTANKIVAITPALEVVTILEDPTGAVMNHPTNVSFGGADMKDLYIGSIAVDYVLKARSPVAGMPLVHQR